MAALTEGQLKILESIAYESIESLEGTTASKGVALVNRYRFGQGQSPVHSAWFQPRRPSVVTEFRGEGESDLRPVSYPGD